MLVSKKITLTANTAVELLAGEELEQPYELLLSSSASSSVHLGDASVSSAEPLLSDFSPNGTTVFRIRNESLWAVSSVSVNVSVLAYSTE
jgi:hypothetical protein